MCPCGHTAVVFADLESLLVLRACLPGCLFFSLSGLRFYYDRTHKGNDWNAVRLRLSAEIASGKKSEKAATKEMLALLKDKYSRYYGWCTRVMSMRRWERCAGDRVCEMGVGWGMLWYHCQRLRA